jgi:glycosyltransferase involved in cell wall biosynthesis
MRIVMLSWEFPPRIVGGIARHVCGLSRALSRFGVEVHVFTYDFPGTDLEERVDGVHVHRIDSYKFPAPDFPSWNYMMNLNMQRAASEFIRDAEGAVDILHAHDWLVAIAAMGLKHMFRIPLVATIHSTEYGRRNGLHTPYHRMVHEMEHWLTYEAWRAICCSEYMASHVVWALGLPRGKIDVIPNGVEPKEYGRLYERESIRGRYASPSEKLVLFVGRLVYEKGANVLVQAMPSILSRVNAKLVMVGDGYMKDQLMAQARYLGVEKKVYVTGFLDDETLRTLYQAADVCVFPSLYEPFGIVALEAMASKTPVVVSDVGGLSEIVEHDKTGVRIYPNSADSLAWGVTKVLTDPQYTENLRSNAYRKLQEVYDWDKIAIRTKTVYETVLAEYNASSWKLPRRQGAT